MPQFKILFRIQWIPRTLLTDVDALSRKTDFDDWGTIVYLFKNFKQENGDLSADIVLPTLGARSYQHFLKIHVSAYFRR